MSESKEKTSSPAWHTAIDSGLHSRLMRPLTQPGMLDHQLTNSITHRIDNMTAGLQLAVDVNQRWGRTENISGQPKPIVYAQRKRFQSPESRPSGGSMSRTGSPSISPVQAKMSQQVSAHSPTAPIKANNSGPAAVIQRKQDPSIAKGSKISSNDVKGALSKTTEVGDSGKTIVQRKEDAVAEKSRKSRADISPKLVVKPMNRTDSIIQAKSTKISSATKGIDNQPQGMASKSNDVQKISSSGNVAGAEKIAGQDSSAVTVGVREKISPGNIAQSNKIAGSSSPGVHMGSSAGNIAGVEKMAGKNSTALAGSETKRVSSPSSKALPTPLPFSTNSGQRTSGVVQRVAVKPLKNRIGNPATGIKSLSHQKASLNSGEDIIPIKEAKSSIAGGPGNAGIVQRMPALPVVNENSAQIASNNLTFPPSSPNGSSGGSKPGIQSTGKSAMNNNGTVKPRPLVRPVSAPPNFRSESPQSRTSSPSTNVIQRMPAAPSPVQVTAGATNTNVIQRQSSSIGGNTSGLDMEEMLEKVERNFMRKLAIERERRGWRR